MLEKDIISQIASDKRRIMAENTAGILGNSTVEDGLRGEVDAVDRAEVEIGGSGAN